MEALYCDEASSVVLVVRGEDFSRALCMQELDAFIAPGRSAFLLPNLDPHKLGLGPDGDQLSTLDSDDPQSRAHSMQLAAGLRLMTPDPGESEDSLIALENELDASLYEGQNWHSHLQEALRGVDTVLDELQTALGQAGESNQVNSTGSQSTQAGIVALERARAAMQQLRLRHLPED